MPGPELAHGTSNRVLDALSRSDLALLRPHLQRVSLPYRKRLQAENREIDKVYFLDSGLASVIATGRRLRKQAEVGILGRESMTGFSVLLGVDRSPLEIIMQVEGSGYSIGVAQLREALSQSDTLARPLLRAAYAFFIQGAYTALANAQGRIEERLARWLLMADDRLAHDELKLTHDFLAVMLGVRRAGVTVAIHKLVEQHCIDVGRGRISILDRPLLEEIAASLYGVPESELMRIYGGQEGGNLYEWGGSQQAAAVAV